MKIQGWIGIDEYGEDDDCLVLYTNNPKEWVCKDKESLVEHIEYDVTNAFCSVRYFLSDEEVTEEQATERWLGVLFGKVDADYVQRYSEITGYLWTDSKLNVGGHDLEAELRSHVKDEKMYLILIIEAFKPFYSFSFSHMEA